MDGGEKDGWTAGRGKQATGRPPAGHRQATGRPQARPGDGDGMDRQGSSPMRRRRPPMTATPAPHWTRRACLLCRGSWWPVRAIAAARLAALPPFANECAPLCSAPRPLNAPSASAPRASALRKPALALGVRNFLYPRPPAPPPTPFSPAPPNSSRLLPLSFPSSPSTKDGRDETVLFSHIANTAPLAGGTGSMLKCLGGTSPP